MARGKPSEQPAVTVDLSTSSGLTAHVTVERTEELEVQKRGWITRRLLSIPEPWLEKWGLKINAASAVFCVAYTVVALWLTLGGWFRQIGLTPGQSLAASMGWLPVLMAVQLVPAARLAHMLAHFDVQRQAMHDIDQGMADTVARAIFEAVQRAQAMQDGVEQKGPTIQ